MASLTDAFENDIFLSIVHGALITYKIVHKMITDKTENILTVPHPKS